jgi:hypothetical protein
MPSFTVIIVDHISSPVTLYLREEGQFWSLSVHLSNSKAPGKQFCFCSCISSCGTNLAETYIVPRSSDISHKKLLLLQPLLWIVSLLSFHIELSYQFIVFPGWRASRMLINLDRYLSLQMLFANNWSNVRTCSCTLWSEVWIQSQCLKLHLIFSVSVLTWINTVCTFEIMLTIVVKISTTLAEWVMLQ